MPNTAVFQKSRDVVVGGIGEGIVLAMLQRSNFRAFRYGEKEKRNPDIRLYDHKDKEHFIEVKVKENGCVDYDSEKFIQYESHRADIIVITPSSSPYLWICRYEYALDMVDCLELEPLMECKPFLDRFPIKQIAHDCAIHLIGQFLVYPRTFPNSPPSQ